MHKVHLLTVVGLYILQIALCKLQFDSLLRCLKYYERNHGPVASIRYNFVIPDTKESSESQLESWPQESRGIALGKLVSRIRTRGDFSKTPEQRRALAKLGLMAPQSAHMSLLGTKEPTRTPSMRSDIEFRRIVHAVTIFNRTHGHVEVPVTYVVSSETSTTASAWPAELVGLRLGQRLDGIRRRGNYVRCYEHRREELESLGVRIAHRRRRHSDEDLLEALVIFKVRQPLLVLLVWA